MTFNHDESNGAGDFMAVLRDRMPEKQRRVTDLLGRVNEVYVECGRDKVLREAFDKFMTYVLALQRYGREGKGAALFVTGESGAGKTDAVEHLLKNNPIVQPVSTSFGLIRPCVSVTLQGPADLTTLANKLLHAINYKPQRQIARGQAWSLLPDQLLARKVLVIHIDEVQHLMHYKNEQEGLANSLKGLMNNPQWPVSFVLSGLPKINKLILIDEQSERRQFSVPLPPIVLPDERKLVTRIISKLCAAAELDCTKVLQSDLPERLAHAANYQFGRIADATICAIQIAILKDATEIDRDHFADAYADRSHARDRKKMNPFLVSDWQNLDPGFFVVTPTEDKQ